MSREIRYPSPAIPKVFPQVEITDGGTDADTGLQAVQNLGGIHVSEYSQALKAVRLNSEGEIPSDHAPQNIQPLSTLVGDTFPATSQAVPYEITNYSSFIDYDITVSAGTVSRSGNTITFNTPAQEGVVTMRVNSRELQINVENQKPKAPTILSPVNLSVNVGERPTLQASAFEMNKGSDTHLNTDWEVATDAAFTNIISQSLADSANKLSWTVNVNLSVNTQYFARVRYRGTNTGPGNYSAVASFTTKEQFFPTLENNRTLPSVAPGTGADTFALNAIAISDDGTRCVAGEQDGADNFYNSGVVHIYRRENNAWVPEYRVGNQNFFDGNNFGGQCGITVAINQDGTVVAFGNPGHWQNTGTQQEPDVSYEGIVSVYRRTGTTWNLIDNITEEQTTPPEDGNRGFGRAISMNAAGTRIVVTRLSSITHCLATVFDQIGGPNGIFSQTFTGYFNPGSQMGGSVAMTPDGNMFVVGIENGAPNPTVAVGGAVAVFRTLTGNSNGFQQSHTINSPEAVASNRFGTSVDISDDGRLIFVGDPKNTNSSGAVYVFRNVTPYASAAYSQLGSKIVIPSTPANREFGGSVSANGVGSYFAVGASKQPKTVSGTTYTNHGSVYIYSLNENTGLATMAAELAPNSVDSQNNLLFGSSLSFQRNTEKLLIGGPGYNGAAMTSIPGAFYTFV